MTKLIKTTLSVCTVCLNKVPARVSEENGRVWLDKTCPDHGEQRVLLAVDPRFYYKNNRELSCGPGGCGGMFNHSCTLMFEITERCNLTCPTCFALSSPKVHYRLTRDTFVEQLDHLLESGKRDADIVQLSGGEPTIHPEFLDIVDACFERGVQKVFVNTNGIEFAKRPELLEHLAQYGGKLQLYLQFDGFRPSTHEAIRGAKGLLDLKLKTLTRAYELGIHALPVMTVTRDINLDEVGDVVKFALDNHPQCRGVMLQPAMYAGRYENEHTAERVTVGELAAVVQEQTDLFTLDDFGPIPCSDPNCFSMAVAVKLGEDLVPVSRYFPKQTTWADPGVTEGIEQFADRLPQHMVGAMEDNIILDQLLDALADGDGDLFRREASYFVLSIKPFMDSGTYDQDRIDACCVHVVDRSGNPVSLCEYNTLRRPRGLL
ncbi:MAG: putative radical SAM superfamily Fe-S cluster-containing enzyme [Myxococcota bacterium]